MNFVPKSPRKQTAHEWLDYLRKANGIGGILAKTENLAKLRITLQNALEILNLGYLSPKIEVSWRSESQNELLFLVSSATVANRLQQILPSLINELGKLGVYCKAIKIKIKPISVWEVKPRSFDQKDHQPKALNAVARQSWEELLGKLSPGSELYKAVEQLLRKKPK
jgi:hypothetical protein